MKINHNWINTILIVIVGIIVLVGSNQSGVNIGGTTAGIYNVIGSGNYQVDGTVVIDTNGNVDAPITSTTGTFSSTLAVTGETTLQGVLTRSQTQAFDTATTTVCSLQSPSATSTLVRAGATFDVSSTTASLITMAKATTAFATTTLLGVVNSGADAQGTVIASSTPTATLLDAEQVFGPNEWFVIGMAGGIGNFSPTGDCWATWTSGN